MTQDPPPLVIENGTVVMPDGLVEEGRIVCEAGRIAAVGKRVRRPRRREIRWFRLASRKPAG